MRRVRRRTWRIEPGTDGLVNLVRNGRQVMCNVLPSVAQAYLRTHAASADRIQRAEDDGYLVTVRR